jgi:hypothetical protein
LTACPMQSTFATAVFHKIRRKLTPKPQGSSLWPSLKQTIVSFRQFASKLRHRDTTPEP